MQLACSHGFLLPRTLYLLKTYQLAPHLDKWEYSSRARRMLGGPGLNRGQPGESRIWQMGFWIYKNYLWRLRSVSVDSDVRRKILHLSSISCSTALTQRTTQQYPDSLWTATAGPDAYEGRMRTPAVVLVAPGARIWKMGWATCIFP